MKKICLSLLLMLIAVHGVWAQDHADIDYNQRNVFNRVSDWSVTIGKSPDERQRIISQRMQLRARRRQSDWQRHHHHGYEEDQQYRHYDDHR